MIVDNLKYIAEPLRDFAIPVDELTLDPRNARLHSRRNLDAIKDSLERFGQVEPLVVQKQGMIVRAGNGRLAVMRELGWTHAAVVVVDQADVEAVAYAIASNRTAELAEWDYETLVAILDETALDMDLVPGFTNEDLKLLVSDQLWEDVPTEELDKQVESGVLERPLMLRGEHAARIRKSYEAHGGGESLEEYLMGLLP